MPTKTKVYFKDQKECDKLKVDNPVLYNQLCVKGHPSKQVLIPSKPKPNQVLNHLNHQLRLNLNLDLLFLIFLFHHRHLNHLLDLLYYRKDSLPFHLLQKMLLIIKMLYQLLLGLELLVLLVLLELEEFSRWLI